MAISTEQIKELRASTGAGILDCRKALEEADGDYDAAVNFLREKGLAKAAKRAGKDASEGILELYSHGDGRVGVIVEVNCETDFVARGDDFRHFAHELALQIAAASPQYVNEEDIPAEVLENEREIAAAQARDEGKPDKIIPRIVDGRLEKFKEEAVLMRQPNIRDESTTIEEMLQELVVKTGEKILVRRFERWEVGENVEKK
jgi:elongation factor Ts